MGCLRAPGSIISCFATALDSLSVAAGKKLLQFREKHYHPNYPRQRERLQRQGASAIVVARRMYCCCGCLPRWELEVVVGAVAGAAELLLKFDL